MSLKDEDFARGCLKIYLKKKFNLYNFIIKTFNLLHDPDSIKTGTNGRDVVVVDDVMGGILTGVDLTREAPTSIDSASM